MFFRNNINTKYIFVIGTGRSGTHFLGRIIGRHSEIKMLLEDKKTFPLVLDATIVNPNSKSSKEKLVSRYMQIANRSNKKYILEKSHPNIWLVEDLMNSFQDSYFIGIQRDVYQVVNSMLNHGGVLKWFKKLPLNQESDFLGINKFNIDYYKDLPLEAKCTLRWMSHTNRLEYLSHNFQQVIKINYQKLVEDYKDVIDYLSAIFEVNFHDYAEAPNKLSLQKQNNLTSEQRMIIKETIEKEEASFKHFDFQI